MVKNSKQTEDLVIFDQREDLMMIKGRSTIHNSSGN